MSIYNESFAKLKWISWIKMEEQDIENELQLDQQDENQNFENEGENLENIAMEENSDSSMSASSFRTEYSSDEYEDDELQLTCSQRGNPKICLRDFLFHITSQTSRSVYWICDESVKNGNNFCAF